MTAATIHSIMESTDQSDNQSIQRSINPTIDQSINRLTLIKTVDIFNRKLMESINNQWILRRKLSKQSKSQWLTCIHRTKQQLRYRKGLVENDVVVKK